MPLMRKLRRWPVIGQRSEPSAGNASALSPRTRNLTARTKEADRIVGSICPYCAVGCGQAVYVRDEKIINIEGDLESPISRGRLCAKGAATYQLVTNKHRIDRVLHRRPYGREWEEIPLEKAVDMVAKRVWKSRSETWEEVSADGNVTNRTMGIAHLGGATLDNEENYLIKKLFTALGIVQIENQARI